MRFFTFEESATIAGHCRWFEQRLFEVLGAWAEAEEEPRTKLLLRAHSFRHAWHAALWEERLPVSGPLDRGALTVPAGGGVAAFVDALAAPDRRGQGIERLTGVYRVAMPRLVASYAGHLERANPTSEGPTIRRLRLLVDDEERSWREGEGLLESLLGAKADAERAAAHQSALEARAVAAGRIPSAVGPSGPASRKPRIAEIDPRHMT